MRYGADCLKAQLALINSKLALRVWFCVFVRRILDPKMWGNRTVAWLYAKLVRPLELLRFETQLALQAIYADEHEQEIASNMMAKVEAIYEETRKLLASARLAEPPKPPAPTRFPLWQYAPTGIDSEANQKYMAMKRADVPAGMKTVELGDLMWFCPSRPYLKKNGYDLQTVWVAVEKTNEEKEAA